MTKKEIRQYNKMRDEEKRAKDPLVREAKEREYIKNEENRRRLNCKYLRDEFMEDFEIHKLTYYPQGIDKNEIAKKTKDYMDKQRAYGMKAIEKLQYATNEKTPDIFLAFMILCLITFGFMSLAFQKWYMPPLILAGIFLGLEIIMFHILVPIRKKSIYNQYKYCYDRELAKEYEDMCSVFKQDITRRAINILNPFELEIYKTFQPMEFWGYAPDGKWWNPTLLSETRGYVDNVAFEYHKSKKQFHYYFQSSIVHCGVIICYKKKFYIYEEKYNLLTGEAEWILNEHSVSKIAAFHYIQYSDKPPHIYLEYQSPRDIHDWYFEFDYKYFYLVDTKDLDDWHKDYKVLQPLFDLRVFARKYFYNNKMSIDLIEKAPTFRELVHKYNSNNINW